ncbi:MAG: esterase/lipase family protein [Candidatus Hodarchaeota archaeon]
MSVERAIYEIKTKHGTARLINKTVDRTGFPILFIHGFGSTPEVWFKYSDSLGEFFLQKEEIDVWSLGLSNAIFGDIELLAQEDLYASLNFIYQRSETRVHIIAHSVGGIIVRFLLCPHINHSFLHVEEFVRGVSLLSVPNHGTNKFKSDRIWNMMSLVTNYISFNQLFVQVLRSSKLINSLNRNQPCLNPKIKWQNAISTFDNLIEPESMRFAKENLLGVDIEQREFPCDHTVYPLKWLFNDNYPPIHRYSPVAEWIYENLFTESVN